MKIPLNFMQKLQSGDSVQVWADILDYAWKICAAPFDMFQNDISKPEGKLGSEVTNRDRKLAALDLFLATAGWDLWEDYESAANLASAKLAKWWEQKGKGKAVLILDGLSLREVPWILQQVKNQGYTIHQAGAVGAELPADTTSFAKALGFSSRSALENNSAGKSHCLTGAFTDSVNLPWEDCAGSINSEPSWVLWHHWPDHRLHETGKTGKGLSLMVPEMAEQLTGDGFWKLVERMSTGRRLVITSDHGYAASGNFPDVGSKEQALYLKNVFKAQRFSADCDEPGRWVPPIDIILETRHGRNRFVLGRRKWKAQGGYPTLTHCGLSVLEVAVPFIEISR